MYESFGDARHRHCVRVDIDDATEDEPDAVLHLASSPQFHRLFALRYIEHIAIAAPERIT